MSSSSPVPVFDPGEPSREVPTWGWVGTVLLFSVVFVLTQGLAYVGTGTVATAVFPELSEQTLQDWVTGSNESGSLTAVFLVLVALMGVPMSLLAARLRKGTRLVGYFAFRSVPRQAVWRWVMASLLLALCWDIVAGLAGRPVVTDFMRQNIETTHSDLLLLLALVVAAPAFEEVLFRGFAFAGLSKSALGARGAIVVTALAWALIHLQYDWIDKGAVFLFGLLLGWARVRSGSLWTPLLVHAALNALAYMEWVVLERVLA
jgi:uncharacterized protein